MSRKSSHAPETLELLAGYVLADLSERELGEAEISLDAAESRELVWELERAAAGVQLALEESQPPDPMPGELLKRLHAEGVAMVEQRQRVSAGANRGTVVDAALGDATERPAGDSAGDAVQPARLGPRRREWLAWLCAAAAVLVAAWLWQRPSTPPTLSAAERRALLLDQNPNSLVRVPWQPGKTPFEAEVSGDVVWDQASQQGYLRFENMPINDPQVEQYQLWIIDPARDDVPIDGGVFNVSDRGEAVVEMKPKLEVLEPVAFAVTIEKPGGVVVSSQERLPLLAPISG